MDSLSRRILPPELRVFIAITEIDDGDLLVAPLCRR